jgi:hypothetical protein
LCLVAEGQRELTVFFGTGPKSARVLNPLGIGGQKDGWPIRFSLLGRVGILTRPL